MRIEDHVKCRPSRFAYPALLLGNVALAFGPWLVRLADIGPVAAGFWRLALALALPLAAGARCSGSRSHWPGRKLAIAVAFAAFFFAADLAAWHAGIRLTKLGNATLFGNISSFAFAAWGLWLARKWPSRDPGRSRSPWPPSGCAALMSGSAELTPATCAATCSRSLAGLLYTFYLIIVERARGQLQPLPLLFLASLFGAVMLLPFASRSASGSCPSDWTAAVRARPRQPGHRPGPAGLCARPCPAAWSSASPCSPSRRISALIGWVAYDETLTALDWVGAVVIGVALVLGPLARAAKPSAQLAAVTDPTPLEAVRAQLALAVGENAVFDGWTAKAVDSAAGQLGIDPAMARLAFPKDQAGMIDAYIAGVDAAMAAHFTPEGIAGDEDPRAHPRAGLVPAGDDGPGARGGALGAGHPRHAAECGAGPRASAGAAPT